MNMKFYDLHVHSAFSEGKSSLEEIAKTAKLLGFSGICFAEYFESEEKMEELKREIERISKEVGIEIYLGFEARNVKELKLLAKLRREFDVLLARGGSLKLNRAACETPEVDILTHPELDRKDSGFNHVLAKLAHKNNVAIEINFREVLMSSKESRSRILKNMRLNVRLAKKYGVPIICCSGAISHLEMRDPKILASFLTLLGLELKEAKECLSKIPANILNLSKERRSEKWIMPGVRVVS